MTRLPDNLAQLRLNRDLALQRATAGITNAKSQVQSLDSKVIQFAGNHPFVAMGGALAAGVAAGLLLGGHSLRTMARATALVVLKPLALDFLHRLVQPSDVADETEE
jgi:hypothetical protein